MGELPERHPILEPIAKVDRKAPALGLLPLSLGVATALRPKLLKYGAHVLYRTLGRTLPDGAAAAAPLWFTSHIYARRHGDAVQRAGHRGSGRALAESLFTAIMEGRSGVLLSRHEHDDSWSFLKHPDRRVHLDVPEMLAELAELADEADPSDERPFVLIAGERRAYNANTIFRDPNWRKTDKTGALRIHPSDAKRLGLEDGATARCRSERGSIDVTVAHYDRIRPGVVTLPHGYGLQYEGKPHGPALNVLTSGGHRDKIAGTPFHKYVRVAIEPA